MQSHVVIGRDAEQREVVATGDSQRSRRVGRERQARHKDGVCRLEMVQWLVARTNESRKAQIKNSQTKCIK